MKLSAVKPMGNYDILITYEDGSQRIFHGYGLWDVSRRLAPLKDITFFNKVKIYDCQHTIGWPGPGDLQIAPEWLEEWSTPAVATA